MRDMKYNIRDSIIEYLRENKEKTCNEIAKGINRSFIQTYRELRWLLKRNIIKRVRAKKEFHYSLTEQGEKIKSIPRLSENNMSNKLVKYMLFKERGVNTREILQNFKDHDYFCINEALYRLRKKGLVIRDGSLWRVNEKIKEMREIFNG